MTQLGIGSAQFGLSYGVTNSSGVVDAKVTRQILGAAKDWGIHYVDTAPAYGYSEQVLGEVLQDLRLLLDKAVWQVIGLDVGDEAQLVIGRFIIQRFTLADGALGEVQFVRSDPGLVIGADLVHELTDGISR